MNTKLETINMKEAEVLHRDSGLSNCTDIATCVAYRMHI